MSNEVTAKHCIISENCHRAHGGKMEALEAAFDMIRDEYRMCVAGWRKKGKVPTMHLRLAVEMPEVKR